MFTWAPELFVQACAAGATLALEFFSAATLFGQASAPQMRSRDGRFWPVRTWSRKPSFACLPRWTPQRGVRRERKDRIYCVPAWPARGKARTKLVEQTAMQL